MSNFTEKPDYLESDSSLRREALIKNMMDKEKMGVDCSSCTGICCTYKANSMSITAIETEDIYQYLLKNNLWNEELEQILKDNISEFRLNIEISTGRNSSFRRTYTCPFFKNKSLGCDLPREIKPYGCLGFNANSSAVTDGEDCSSDLSTLENRESLGEDQLNSELKSKHNYYWDKLPIPSALLERHEREK